MLVRETSFSASQSPIGSEVWFAQGNPVILGACQDLALGLSHLLAKFATVSRTFAWAPVGHYRALAMMGTDESSAAAPCARNDGESCCGSGEDAGCEGRRQKAEERAASDHPNPQQKLADADGDAVPHIDNSTAADGADDDAAMPKLEHMVPRPQLAPIRKAASSSSSSSASARRAASPSTSYSHAEGHAHGDGGGCCDHDGSAHGHDDAEGEIEEIPRPELDDHHGHSHGGSGGAGAPRRRSKWSLIEDEGARGRYGEGRGREWKRACVCIFALG